MIPLIQYLFKLILKFIGSVIFFLLLLILALYSGTNIYEFPTTPTFSGSKIFNPYESLATKKFKSNFHAHSKAWNGLTNGTDTDNEVIEAYVGKGYDVACLSNYHKISRYTGDKPIVHFPVYEHGYSIKKAHYLAINATDVSYWDFPLWQSSSHQQTIIETLKTKAEVVAIAHPKFGGGRSFENMESLTGYHLTEVLNHYRNSEEYWDRALSVGRLSWIIGNDDIHDIKDPEIFQIWNHVYAENPEEVVSNLKSGKNYATKSFSKSVENALYTCKMTTENSFEVKFENMVDTILFIGQSGKIKQKTLAIDSASYTFTPDDTYIRVVAKNANSAIYLNPLIRYDGSYVIMAADLSVTKKHILTWMWRLACLFLMFFSGFLWIKLLRF